jgi:hypothetical protein
MTRQQTAETTLNASRTEQLAPYLDLLRPDPGQGRPDVPPSLALDGADVPLDSWERTVLQKAAALSQEVYPWSDRIAEGLAFLAWSRGRLCDLGSVTRDDVVLALAIGIAVLEDLQRDVDGLVLAGRMGLAKQLTAFRHKIVSEVTRFKEATSPEELVEAETLSRTLVPPVTRSRPTLVEEEPEGPVQFKRDVRVKGPVRTLDRPREKSARGRVQKLAIALAVSGFAWGAFTVLRPGTLVIPEVDSTKLRSIEGVSSVLQRPPSLYVTVDDAHWGAAGADRRRELVQKLADVVSPVGYRGIHVRLVSGPSVAQWLQQSGVRLLEPSGADSPS